MARPALSTSRSLEIMDFLARFPERTFTLSEIVEGVGINLASCHAILNALGAQGYVTRAGRRKSYRLGPALVAMGHSAMRAQPLIARADAVAQMLSSELDLPMLLSTRIGEEILGVLAIDTPDGRSAGLEVGERMPLVPPIGASFVAWGDEAEAEAWLNRGEGAPDDDRRALWQAGLIRLRERGYQIELRQKNDSELAERMTAMASGERATRYKAELLKFVHALGSGPIQPDEISPGESYDLLLLAAPIFDRDGQCVYNLCIGGFRGPLDGAEVRALGDRLLKASLTVMRDSSS